MAAAVPMGFLKQKPNPNLNSHHGHDQTMMRYRFQLFQPLIISCKSSRMASYRRLATYRVPSRMSLHQPPQTVSSMNYSKFRCSCSPISVDSNVTPFATAGILSKFSFSWLNPLLRDGKEEVMEEKNIPKLRVSDTAKSCYTAFMEKLAQQKQKSRSIASAIFIWQWKEIIVSGVFALIKVLALTSCPILLGAFVEVVSRRSPNQQQKYALVACLFWANCLESVAERQWSFWTRLIGLRMKSMLCAAIYQKQLLVPSTSYVSAAQIMNYVTVDDAKRIGEFPYWFHQMWITFVQIFLAVGIVYYSVGSATFAALLVIALTVMGNSPLAKLQHKYLTNLMVAQDKRLKSITEAVRNMKVLKLYAWETHFRNMVDEIREEKSNWLSKILYQRGYYFVLFWSSPTIVSIMTFWICNLLRIPLNASNIFMFLATLRIIQQPIVAAFIEAKVAITRIGKFLEAPELYKRCSKGYRQQPGLSLLINSNRISWDHNSSKPTLADINLEIKNGEKVAICGEVGSGKSTLIAAILGEVPSISGTVHVNGEVAYVSETAWIQTGSIRENILFRSPMDHERYLEVLAKCSLVKDMEMLSFGDQTGIGERGVNLSRGQKQPVQLARALYQDADLYLLDDPFSAVDAHTAAKLFKEYVMDSLSRKTLLLVTHQVDFLPEFDKVLVVSEGKILKAAPYGELLASCKEFQNLVLAHSETSHPDSVALSSEPREETEKILTINGANLGEQLIKKEAKETGDTGLRPYVQYLSQSNGFYFFMSILVHLIYIIGQLVQNLWLATGVQGSSMNQSKLILVYVAISFVMSFFLCFHGTARTADAYSE